MATTLKFRRGGQASSDAFTGADGELFINTDKKTVVVHDGSTQGGVELLSATSLGQLNAHLIPDGNEIYDLGEPENKWRDLYLSNATIHMDDVSLSKQNIIDSVEIKSGNVPSGPSADGVKGTMIVGTAYAYLCVDTNKWIRFSVQSSW